MRGSLSGRLSAAILLSGLLFVSCGSPPALEHGLQGSRLAQAPLRYSIVYFIHGDGEYLYHDRYGAPLTADEVTLAKARRAAEDSPDAEVFIFHEKRKQYAWLVFPKRDGEFFYYRSGRLAWHEEYRREGQSSAFRSAVERYRLYRSDDVRGVKTIVYYFGHEIPEAGGEGYDASYAGRPFTIDTLAGLLGSLRETGSPFDLVVLSTCYNGTPYTIAALAPITRLILASPDNLHLSYFPIPSFGRDEASAGTIAALTRSLAREAFDTLSQTVQTAVSVAVYDAGLVQPYLQSVDSLYKASLAVVGHSPIFTREHCDCARMPGFVRPGMSRGVEILYRPPKFGRSQQTTAHSGWECWKITGLSE